MPAGDVSDRGSRHTVGMDGWVWLLAAAGGAAALWLAALAALVALGRRRDARALASLLPDCARLVGRLLRDPRVPRRRKLLLAALLAYLALPFDLVPDVVPIAGQLDDALLVALVLRRLVRGGGEELVREHWPGSEATLRLVLAAAGIRR